MTGLYQFKENLAFSIVRSFPTWVSPQMLSWLRVVLAVPLIYLLINEQRLAALIVFIFAALLDYLDGPLARLTNRVTTLGKLLDPLAEKLIALPTIVLLGDYWLTPFLIMMIIGLELLLIIMSLILKPIFEAIGQKHSLGANIFGKYKFTIQVTLILGMFLTPEISTLIPVAQALAWLAVLLSIASIIKHMMPEKHA